VGIEVDAAETSVQGSRNEKWIMIYGPSQDDLDMKGKKIRETIMDH
jgi:hypothetical protein